MILSKNKTILVKKGDMVHFPEGVDYNIVADDNEELFVIHFDGYGLKNDTIELFTPERPEMFVSLFEDIYNTWRQGKPGYQLKCTALMYSMLHSAHIQMFDHRFGSSAAFFIQKTTEYLRMNFHNPEISVRELAVKAGVSETYFRKKFRDFYGCAPLGYINNMRIEYAAGLLQSHMYTIAEIAEKSGFSSPKYFSTLFKKTKNISPSKFGKH